jgi:hypothetical protein
MIGYVKAEEIAMRWDVSIRQVQRLCVSGRIDGAIKFGTTWAIPENALKPTRTGKLKPGRKPKSNEGEKNG